MVRKSELDEESVLTSDADSDFDYEFREHGFQAGGGLAEACPTAIVVVLVGGFVWDIGHMAWVTHKEAQQAGEHELLAAFYWLLASAFAVLTLSCLSSAIVLSSISLYDCGVAFAAPGRACSSFGLEYLPGFMMMVLCPLGVVLYLASMVCLAVVWMDTEEPPVDWKWLSIIGLVSTALHSVFCFCGWTFAGLATTH
eukprot:TRINITY_DN111521_c0_g1_i1.p1 TRINITY_DN111521_c0_g1~~TRINITY_DN111521_c0_g1_i1.p1  ORF type:complete len:197 (-),score=21.00 TRINITY_DN111521_c0_g1_i1:357-947(-)